MSRPYGTAFLAVILTVSTLGFAEAKSKTVVQTPTVATALQSGSISMSEDAGASAPPSANTPFTVAPELRQKLREIAIAEANPSATADLAMWSAAPANERPSGPSAKSGNPKRPDAIHRFARGIISRTSSIAMSLTRSAMRFIGTPYVFGGTSPSGFDCSGYTQHVFAMLGIALPRLADAQYYAGHKIVGGMTTGDLVFFQTYEPGPSHVGIYVGDGKFIHSSSHGVMISRLDNSYWRARYIGAKRIVAFH